MPKNSSKFRKIALRAVSRYALFLLVIFGVWGIRFSGYCQTAEQNRKMARIEASYLTHLTKYIQWDSSSQKSRVKIIIHGDDPYKFYESLKYAIDISLGGERIADFEIMHFTNDQTDLALKNIKEGLLNTRKNTGILGRWQKLSENPKIICDIAHNEDGLKEIIKQLQATSYKKLHVVFGTVNDKDLNILSLLPKDAKYYFCKANIPRGLNEKYLKKIANKKGLNGESYSSVKKALGKAKRSANKEDLIFIGGSTFIVAEIL